MIFDRNIIKILYSIEGEANEEYYQYLLNCMQSCSESITIYESTEAKISEEFKKNIDGFNSAMFGGEDPNMDDALKYVDELNQEPQFKEILDGYIDRINGELLEKTSEKDPQVVDNLDRYLSTLEGAVVKNYLEIFIKPVAQEIEIKKLLDEIDEMEYQDDEEIEEEESEE